LKSRQEYEWSENDGTRNEYACRSETLYECQVQVTGFSIKSLKTWHYPDVDGGEQLNEIESVFIAQIIKFHLMIRVHTAGRTKTQITTRVAHIEGLSQLFLTNGVQEGCQELFSASMSSRLSIIFGPKMYLRWRMCWQCTAYCGVIMDREQGFD